MSADVSEFRFLEERYAQIDNEVEIIFTIARMNPPTPGHKL